MEGNQNPAQPGQNQSQVGQSQAGGSTVSQSQMPSSQPQPSQVGVQSDASQMGTEPKQPHKGGVSKRTLILFIIFVIAAIATVGVYLMGLNRESPTIPPSPPVSTPVPQQVSPEKELESIDVGDIDKDLEEIEADLQSL